MAAILGKSSGARRQSDSRIGTPASQCAKPVSLIWLMLSAQKIIFSCAPKILQMRECVRTICWQISHGCAWFRDMHMSFTMSIVSLENMCRPVIVSSCLLYNRFSSLSKGVIAFWSSSPSRDCATSGDEIAGTTCRLRSVSGFEEQSNMSRLYPSGAPMYLCQQIRRLHNLRLWRSELKQ